MSAYEQGNEYASSSTQQIQEYTQRRERSKIRSRVRERNRKQSLRLKDLYQLGIQGE
jgi:hypothetical protein